MAAAAEASSAESFLANTDEKLQLNQYWYSADTIRTFVAEIEECCTQENGGCAFLSTPSVFFSLTNPLVIERSVLFDADADAFATRAGKSFALYNFRCPQDLLAEYHHRFSIILVDPPFITEDVWLLYAEAIKYLLNPNNGKIILSTIAENNLFLFNLLNVHCCKYRPAIPNLIYQYSLYINYDSIRFNQLNRAIDLDEALLNNDGTYSDSRKKNKLKLESLSSEDITNLKN